MCIAGLAAQRVGARIDPNTEKGHKTARASAGRAADAQQTLLLARRQKTLVTGERDPAVEAIEQPVIVGGTRTRWASRSASCHARVAAARYGAPSARS